MKPKYLQAQIDRLQDIQKGMTVNASQWLGQPITVADISAAISQLEIQADNLNTAQTALNKLLEKVHAVVDENALTGNQAETLARGIHLKEPEKLNDYNITLSNRGSGSPLPSPAPAVISSIKDDPDGEGFIITIQPLANATDFEVWRGLAASADAQVLDPTAFSYLAVTKKLQFTDDTIVKGKRYFYRIRGFNRSGKGEWSAALSKVQ